MEKNKEIISEITRIKELFNYGALLNEQTTTQYEKYNKQNPQSYTTESNRYKNLITAFKGAFPDKEFFVTPSKTSIKYVNKKNQEVYLQTNNDDGSKEVKGFLGIMDKENNRVRYKKNVIFTLIGVDEKTKTKKYNVKFLDREGKTTDDVF